MGLREESTAVTECLRRLFGAKIMMKASRIDVLGEVVSWVCGMRLVILNGRAECGYVWVLYGGGAGFGEEFSCSE